MRSTVLAAAVALCLSSTAALAKPARLALVITVDGMGSELFTRLRPRLKGGLGQLANSGAYFPYARYQYAKTSTAPGHATLSTGANPWRHGLVGNRSFDRAAGKPQPILHDAAHPLLEAPPAVEDVSPENLIAEALADRLRLATGGRGKAIALSYKGRSAIAMAGHLGTAYWFNEPTGKFVSGTYYVKEFPEWLRVFNDRKLPESYFGKTWELLLPPAQYTGEDDRSYEPDYLGLSRTFPHPLTGGLPGPGPQFHSAVSRTPMSTEILIQVARAALDGEQLGRDEFTDLLAVSFSGFDRTVHLYGPYSWEAQDALLRLDRALTELLSAAEKAAGGRANLAVVLSSDHGSAALAEEWAAAGLPAGKVNPETLAAALGAAMKAKFGADVVLGVDEDGQDVYLSPKAIADRKLDGTVVRRAAAEWLRAQPQILYAVARDDLYVDQPSFALLEPLRKSYYPERSGDVLFVPKPFHIVMTDPTGTNHSSPFGYDAHVPVIFAGRGIRAGTYFAELDPCDVAPTLAALLELSPPAHAEGKPRAEILTNSRPPAPNAQ